MLDVWLRYEGGGIFRTATRQAFTVASEAYAQGERIRARLTKPRSLNQNALFHAMVQRAFENQRGGPALENWEQLKGYLLVKIGHSTEGRVSLEGMAPKRVPTFGKALALALRMRGDYVAVSYDRTRGELVLRWPARTRDVSRERMSEIIEAVGAEIAAEIVPGVEIKALFDLAKGEAA